MTKHRQQQAAGDHSHQMQAGGDIVVVQQGMSATEVQAIIRSEIERIEGELRATAAEVALLRMQSFGDRLLQTLSERGQLGAFADPDFQFALGDANRAAASNDDQDTEALLVELLANRAEHGNAPRVRLVTKQALIAADKLSKDSLNGLAAMWTLLHIGPKATVRDPEARVVRVRENLRPFVEAGLPQGGLWRDDVDVLGLVRLEPESLRTLKPFAEVIEQKAPTVVHGGYARTAVEDILRSMGDAQSALSGIIFPHPLDAEKIIVACESRAEADGAITETGLRVTRYPRVSALLDHYKFAVDPEARAAFTQSLSEDEIFGPFAAWWVAQRPLVFTSVGHTISFLHTRTLIDFAGAASVAELLELRDAGSR